MQKIYSLLEDMQDGSAVINWFRNKEVVDKLLKEPDYFMNEGSPVILIFPDNLNLEECGFSFDNDEEETL